jgi:hypothetical protein
MKFKKILFCIVFIIASMLIPTFAHASENGQINIDLAKQSAKRMRDLNILAFNDEELDLKVSRQVFSKAIVVACGMNEAAELSTNYSKINDVETENEYSSYINIAISKRLMDLMISDNYFYPNREITFAEACTALVRTLGYYTLEAKGKWDNYYISEANNLGITKGIRLKGEDPLPAWAAAEMFDRFLNTKSKNSETQKFFEQIGLYTELIILEDIRTNDTLEENEVNTDKGVYYKNLIGENFELGKKYRVKIKNKEIIDIYTELNNVDEFIIDENFSMSKLPKYIDYYVNGVKAKYNDVKNNLIKSDTVLLVYNESGTSFEYGVIYHPKYSKPEIATKDIYPMQIGNIYLYNTIINKYGQVIKREHIKSGDIVYEVKDLNEKSRYILVIDKKVEGKLTSMSLNSIGNNYIEIDNVKYAISTTLDNRKLYPLNIEDKISISLGYDDKVEDISKIQYKSGPTIECIVTGNNTTMDKVGNNQIITDKGEFFYLNGMSFDVGGKYKIVVDEEKIVKAERIQQFISKFGVDKFLDNTITYFDGVTTKELTLPRLSAYYYQGVKIDYNNLKNSIKVNSTIILVKNDYNTGYEYGVIIDPIYGTPKINGVTENFYDINYNSRDVIYTVTDINGNSPKTIVFDNRVTGQITAILPNKTYPSSVVIGGKEYEFSKDFDYNEMIYWNTGYKVTLVLGYDGKIVDIYQ